MPHISGFHSFAVSVEILFQHLPVAVYIGRLINRLAIVVVSTIVSVRTDKL